MKRLLLYVHFNKYDHISRHVFYQLEHMRPLFDKLVFISNSRLSESEVQKLRDKHLIDDFIQRENKGYDFAAWHDGMESSLFPVFLLHLSLLLFFPLYYLSSDRKSTRLNSSH